MVFKNLACVNFLTNTMSALLLGAPKFGIFDNSPACPVFGLEENNFFLRITGELEFSTEHKLKQKTWQSQDALVGLYWMPIFRYQSDIIELMLIWYVITHTEVKCIFSTNLKVYKWNQNLSERILRQAKEKNIPEFF